MFTWHPLCARYLPWLGDVIQSSQAAHEEGQQAVFTIALRGGQHNQEGAQRWSHLWNSGSQPCSLQPPPLSRPSLSMAGSSPFK